MKTAISNTIVIYLGILTLEKVNTAVNYCGTFITLAPELNKLLVKCIPFCNKLECLSLSDFPIRVKLERAIISI
jgi:hypothetical protein